MHTIETILTVTPDGEILIPAIAKLPPGEHKAVLVIEEMPTPADRAPKPPLTLHTFSLHNWPPDATYRRQDIYGDNGR